MNSRASTSARVSTSTTTDLVKKLEERRRVDVLPTVSVEYLRAPWRRAMGGVVDDRAMEWWHGKRRQDKQRVDSVAFLCQPLLHAFFVSAQGLFFFL